MPIYSGDPDKDTLQRKIDKFNFKRRKRVFNNFEIKQRLAQLKFDELNNQQPYGRFAEGGLKPGEHIFTNSGFMEALRKVWQERRKKGS